jgi:integrase
MTVNAICEKSVIAVRQNGKLQAVTADRLWTVHDVSPFLGVPVGTLSQWRYMRVGRLVRNVAEGVPLPRVVGKPKRFLTQDQVQVLAEACAPYGTLIKVLAYAGLRCASWWHRPLAG